MAYTPYYPSFPNYGNYYPQAFQPQMAQPQVQQQYPQQQNQVSNVWVTSREEAEQYPVVPNSAVRLWSAKEPVFWLKQADATGKPYIKTYDIVERSESVSGASYGQSAEYVSREELEKVAGVLESVRGELETMKGDLYGVAGRKRKREVIEDDE